MAKEEGMGKTVCVGKMADRSPCGKPAAAWWAVLDKARAMAPLFSGSIVHAWPITIEPLCGIHANQRERAGDRVVRVARHDGRAVGQARA